MDESQLAAGPDALRDHLAAPRTLPRLAAYSGAILWVAAAAGMSAALRAVIGSEDVPLVLLLAVVGAALTGGRGPAVCAAVLAVATFDFFFVPPHFTLAVEEPRAIVTFVVMLVVGLALGTVTHRLRTEARAARAGETRLRVLYALSRAVASGAGAARIGEAVAESLRATGPEAAVVMLPAANGALRAAAGDVASWPGTPDEADAAAWAFTHHFPAGCGAVAESTARWFYLPLIARGRVIGVLGVLPRTAAAARESAALWQALANHAAEALAHVTDGPSGGA